MSQWKDLQRKDRRKRGPREIPPRLLRDMRWVRVRPEEQDRPRHKDLRRWLKEDIKGFMARLSDLEKAWMAKLNMLGRSIAEDKKGVPQDTKTEFLQEELGKLIRDYREQEGLR